MIAATILPYLAVFIAGLIVGRIGAFASGVKHGIEETTKVYFFQKQTIWHDVNLTTPGTDGDIILTSAEGKVWLFGAWSTKDRCLYSASDGIFDWHEITKELSCSKWCYLNDLIEK